MDARNSQPSAHIHDRREGQQRVGQQLVPRQQRRPQAGVHARQRVPQLRPSSSRGAYSVGRGEVVRRVAVNGLLWGREEKALGHRTPLPPAAQEPPSPVSAVSRGVSSYTTSRSPPHCSHLSLGGGGYSPAHLGAEICTWNQASPPLQVPPPQHTGQSPEPGAQGTQPGPGTTTHPEKDRCPGRVLPGQRLQGHD